MYVYCVKVFVLFCALQALTSNPISIWRQKFLPHTIAEKSQIVTILGRKEKITTPVTTPVFNIRKLIFNTAQHNENVR